ncbi:MAG: hypothetical protein JXQ87_10015 [Bacteroidia bacterium]
MKVRPLLKLKLAAILVLFSALAQAQIRDTIISIKGFEGNFYKSRIVLADQFNFNPVKASEELFTQVLMGQNDSIHISNHFSDGYYALDICTKSKYSNENLLKLLIDGFKGNKSAICNYETNIKIGRHTKVDIPITIDDVSIEFEKNRDYKHAGSKVLLLDDGQEQTTISCYFNGIESKDLPVYHVLCAIIAQRNSTLNERMVQSGLALEAGLTFQPARAHDYLAFQVKPNPFGIKESIEALFKELYAMPLFDYTSKAQLDLAKEQIEIEIEFLQDDLERFAPFWIGLNNAGFSTMGTYKDAVNEVTKVDLMDFIRKYINHKPFMLFVEANAEQKKEVESYIFNTKPLEEYVIEYSDKREAKLDTADIEAIKHVAYILNLTSWKKVDVMIYGRANKRKNEKRAKELAAYLDTKSINNELNFIYRRSFGKVAEEKVVFKIAEYEE